MRKKRRASAETRERLKRLRQKYHLGEFKTHSLIKKNKVVSMARRRRRTSKVYRRYTKRYTRRRRTGGLSIKNIALLGLGSGLSGAVGSLANKYLPFGNQNIAGGNLSEALIGFGAYTFGSKIHPAVKTVGAGMLIKVVGDIVENNVAPALSNSLGNVNVNSTASSGVVV